MSKEEILLIYKETLDSIEIIKTEIQYKKNQIKQIENELPELDKRLHFLEGYKEELKANYEKEFTNQN